MILRRVISHVRNQEWTAIVIDFLIVVVGVFVGIQVSNWNVARADERLGQAYVARLLTDLHEDREDHRILSAYYDAVEASAEHTVELLSADDDDLALVIHAYRATEYESLPQRRSTWDEIISSGNAGLLSRAAIEGGLADYFSYNVSTLLLDGFRHSPYRRIVRGIIPHVLQRSIREHCSDVRDDTHLAIGFRSDCDLNVDEALVIATARALRDDATVIKELRNRFSELGEARSTILGDIVLLDRTIIALEGRDPEKEASE